MAGPSWPEDIALHFTGEVEDNEDMVNKREEKAGKSWHQNMSMFCAAVAILFWGRNVS